MIVQRNNKERFSLKKISVSISVKLFILLAMLIAAILFAVLVILSVTGTFASGVKNTQIYVENKLNHLVADITSQCERYSAYSVSFAEDLSLSIEKSLELQGLSLHDLKKDPDLLTSTIQAQYEKCLYALELSESSGAFMILDTTINPNLPESTHSKAGLYIKNMEPNIINSSSSYLMLLRGPSQVGRKNSVMLHPQWKMEFDVADADYFFHPLEAAKSRDYSLSRLYHWSPPLILPNTTEEIMLISVPLIDSKGNTFGVCGLEVSSMLFKLHHIPNNQTYPHLFCVLSPYNENQINTSQSFFAGGYSARGMANKENSLLIRKSKPFNSYFQEDGKNISIFRGLHQTIDLYPEGSAFDEEKWMVSLLLPDKDISSSIIKFNIRLLLFFLILLIGGIISAYFLSKKALTPIAKNILKVGDNDADSSHIAEADNLIYFLSEKNDVENIKDTERGEASTSSVAVVDAFLENIKTLSPAERAVFDLYVEGHSPREAADILCLSINTIKTHNKRIYQKLKVSSRDELNLLISLSENDSH
ncbi:MAG: LuxR C-terminal-related transcriptional regulator [Anaerovoracaceae bacterium]|jgi:DNA-binding CsgD family transcriptional regulator